MERMEIDPVEAVTFKRFLRESTWELRTSACLFGMRYAFRTDFPTDGHDKEFYVGYVKRTVPTLPSRRSPQETLQRDLELLEQSWNMWRLSTVRRSAKSAHK